MVSLEQLRRHPFFAELGDEQVASLAQISDEVRVEAGGHLFYEGTPLASLYLVLEGRVTITLSQPAVCTRVIIPPPGARTREVAVSTVAAGELLAWSALVPPFQATSNARAATRCRLLAIDAAQLRRLCELDPHLGYHLMVRVAQVARGRIQDMHYETLSGAVGAAAGT